MTVPCRVGASKYDGAIKLLTQDERGMSMSLHEKGTEASAAVAAAEAELEAAQERLAAAKARLAAESESEQAEVEGGDAEDVLGSPAEKAPLADPDMISQPAEEPPASPVEAPRPTHSPGQTAGSTGVPPVPPGQTEPDRTASQPAPGTAPSQQPHYGYQQTYPQHPYAAQPVTNTKDHVAAGLLAIFLGWLGIHKFYLGYNTPGFIMLAVTVLGSVFTFGLAGAVVGVISLIEGILYLTKSQSEFEQIYVFGKREWF